jgi:colicin import membrane protein
MPALTDRIEFAPPQQPGAVRAFALAVFAHLLLLVALTLGIRWNKEPQTLSAEAELWSAVPQQAAPKPVEVPAPPPPPPPPPAPRKVETPPPPPPAPAPDIALQREKQRQELARRQQEELVRKMEALEKQKTLEAKRKLEEDKRRQQLEAKKEADERKRKEDEQKLAKQKKQQADEKKLADLRNEQMRRIQGMAGATGSPEATGNAQRSSGPSDSYAGRIRARVKPNIVFTDDVAGNPTAEVEVRMAPDGTITSTRISKSSGVKSWDEAVLRALVKTEVLPRDVDGRVHTPLLLVFRPRD